MSQTKALFQLSVTVPAEAEDAASVILENQFAAWPISYVEPESNSIELSLFLSADQKPSGNRISELSVALQSLADFGLSMSGLTVCLKRLSNRNWKESWKRHFRPLEIGRQLLIRPSWSRRRAKPGQAVVVLDPGLSFGTGQHPTTSFCLRELVRERDSGKAQALLDVGTGSGILAISAAKLGYDPVCGFDHDAESIRVATANARRNRVSDSVQFRRADLAKMPLQTRTQHDVVCANLLADLLISQSRRILNLVKPGGLLIIAGILNSEFEEVERHFSSPGTRPLRRRSEQEWQSGSYRIPA